MAEESGEHRAQSAEHASEPDVDRPKPRAWINHEDGTREPVSPDAITGLDEFYAGWGQYVPDPEAVTFDAWQQSDADHPPGEGQVGYRIVYKTIRTFTFPAIDFSTSNLRVRFANGSINSGAPRFTDALPERTPGYYLKPEWGEIKESPAGEVGYMSQPDMRVHIDNHEDETPHGNYVELLYAVPDGTTSDFASVIAAGRAGVAPLLVALEMQFGPRILGPVLTEEAGAVFSDGHWNRRLGGRYIRLESQASMQMIPGQSGVTFLAGMLQRQVERSDEERRRTRIASQWYLRGGAEADLTIAYVAYWLVLEALELEENSNIAPLRAAIAQLLDVEPSSISDRLGRLYSTRSKLVHGALRSVTCRGGRCTRDRRRAVGVAQLGPPQPHEQASAR